MSITHRQSLSITTNGGNALSGTDTEVGAIETTIDQTFASGYTDYALSFPHSTLQSVILVASQNVTLQFNGTDKVQSLSMTGPPSSGTFTATVLGQTTTAIAYNATAATVQAALVALSSVGTGNVICAGGPLPGTPVSVTFTDLLGKSNTPAVTTTDSLTGGSSSVSTTTAGVAPAPTISLLANTPLVWGTSPGYFSNPFSADVTTVRASCTAATRLQGKFLHN